MYIYRRTTNSRCTMVIHDRSIDKCGKLAEDDVSLDVDGSTNKDWHNTENAKELFGITYINVV